MLSIQILVDFSVDAANLIQKSKLTPSFGVTLCSDRHRNRQQWTHNLLLYRRQWCWAWALPILKVQAVLTLVDDTMVTAPHQLPFDLQFCRLSVVKTFLLRLTRNGRVESQIKQNNTLLLQTISYQTTLSVIRMHDTRHKTDLYRHKINKSYGYRCLKYKEIKVWNSLPNSFKCINSS